MKAAETVEIPTSAIMRHRSAGPTDLAARFSGGRSLTDAAMTVGGARWVARSAASQWRRGVSIGEVLAGARRQAGLTVSQVSHRTRIRETIITAIEGDDYAPCGGDFYARGHIRSIARAVGTDPEPLIREYDSARLMPRALDEAFSTNLKGDAVFALAAVVTREGRVANYEVLFSERASVRRHDTAVETDDVSSVVNAVKQSRFAPAHGVDGMPVAVNMVWLLARTTVKASAVAAIDPPAVRIPPAPRPVDTAPKPDSPSTSVAVPSSTA